MDGAYLLLIREHAQAVVPAPLLLHEGQTSWLRDSRPPLLLLLQVARLTFPIMNPIAQRTLLEWHMAWLTLACSVSMLLFHWTGLRTFSVNTSLLLKGISDLHRKWCKS